jgi:ubiquinone/menaquinone biosynthesis C-methylase UbiE
VTLDDPAVVRAEYEDETRLAARKAAHVNGEGPDAREVLFEAIAEARPERILEVGCGEGELAERLQRELGAEVLAVDQSARMVEITRARGVNALVGNVEQLDLPDGSFDCVVAAWMLFHVSNLERALAEIVRVLAPGGRLVAVTNGSDHLKELFDLVGVRAWVSNFSADDADRILPRHFTRVGRRDAHGWMVFADAMAAQNYIDSLVLQQGSRVPPVDGPIRARRTPSIFVAEKA